MDQGGDHPPADDRSPDGALDKPRPEGREAQAPGPILPILQPTLQFEPEPRRSAIPSEDESWPSPSWSSVLFAIALVCWLFSPRGFLMGRFLSDAFLWLATVCFILGVLILVSDLIGARLSKNRPAREDDSDPSCDDNHDSL